MSFLVVMMHSPGIHFINLLIDLTSENLNGCLFKIIISNEGDQISFCQPSRLIQNFQLLN